jgi:transketolase
MRRAFVEALIDLASRDDQILLLTGDLGFLALEPFRDRFPGRYINCGVAEQNMIGVATGLAEAGFLPFVYSIAPFASLRPLEFIRNGPVLHRLPVRIVGVGMGFEYGYAGPSHYGVEDIGALRTLPSLRIIVPADASQTRTAFSRTWDLPGPTYYSIGKDDQASVQGLNGRFELGRVQLVRTGPDLALVTMGSVATEVMAAATHLEREGIVSTVAIVSGFHPDPAADLLKLADSHPVMITVEAHTVAGGLGSLVATTMAESGSRARLRILGVRESADGTSGSQPDRWRKYGLDSASIAAAVQQALADLKQHDGHLSRLARI